MIDPQLQSFLAYWQSAWADLPAGAGAPERRAHFERIAEAERQPLPAGMRTDEHRVAVPGADRQVRLRSFRPAGAGPLPAFVYLHGGAFQVGSPETHWNITSDLAERTGRVVFSVDYALSPEHVFPAAVDDARAATRWVFAEADALGVDRRAVAIGGDSAGANLAAAMTLDFRGGPDRLQGQLLVYPGLDFNHDRPSYRENPDGPIVTVAGMVQVDAAYCPDAADRLNPLAAPLQARSHAGLPPAFIGVAEHDPLRDDGVAYAERLQAGGTPVRLHRGQGLIHSYLRARGHCAAAAAAFDEMCGWLRTLPR